MARVLVVGGGCRGRELARALREEGHATRIVTRDPATVAAIEEAGAEAYVGDPDRIGTLRYALENVTVLCWLLGTASDDADAVAALHGSRLEMMLSKTIDTTVRGVVYERAGTVPDDVLGAGAAIVTRLAGRSEIPFAILAADPRDAGPWLDAALAAIHTILVR